MIFRRKASYVILVSFVVNGFSAATYCPGLKLIVMGTCTDTARPFIM